MLYDVLIIGGGPAGLSAGIYAQRAGKKCLMIERMMPGGQVALTHIVENYPGIEKTDGMSLATKMFEQATKFGLEIVFSDVLQFDIQGKSKKVKTHEGTFEGKSIILCLGASAKQLNLENEKQFLGRGVSYCATCDGNFFKDKTVAVVGGGNTSLEDVMFLQPLAKKVYLIHRRDEFRGESIMANTIRSLAAEKESNVELVLNSVVTKISGSDKLEEIDVENKATKEKRTIKLDGLFISIGRKPDTELLEGIVKLSDKGYILTDEKMQTNIAGVYAAGDVREKQLRQIITAAADGAIAAINTNDYILENFGS